MAHVSAGNSYTCANCCDPLCLATPPGFHVTFIPKGDLVSRITCMPHDYGFQFVLAPLPYGCCRHVTEGNLTFLHVLVHARTGIESFLATSVSLAYGTYTAPQDVK